MGFILVLVGTFLLGQEVSVDMTPMSSILGSVVVGVGCGLVMGQIATVTMMKVPVEQNGEASGLSETLKEIIGQGFAIAFSGAVLFGSVYSNMTHEYERMESIDLSEEEEKVVMIELEDTFQAITPAEEQEFIQSLPEKTQGAYQEIVDRSAENAFVRTMYVLDIFVVLCINMSFFLPNDKIIEE